MLISFSIKDNGFDFIIKLFWEKLGSWMHFWKHSTIKKTFLNLSNSSVYTHFYKHLFVYEKSEKQQ